MTIKDMIPGQRYLVGDSLGYDIITCKKVELDALEQGVRGVKVTYIDKTGGEDFLFESSGYMFNTYVEARP